MYRNFKIKLFKNYKEKTETLTSIIFQTSCENVDS